MKYGISNKKGNKFIYPIDNEIVDEYKELNFKPTEVENVIISYQRRLFKYYINDQYLSEEELECKNRFVTIDDFKCLTEKVGLQIEQIYGNCQLESYNKDSEDVFVKVRRK